MKIYEVNFDKVIKEQSLEIVKRESLRFDDFVDANNFMDAMRYVTDMNVDIRYDNIGLRELPL